MAQNVVASMTWRPQFVHPFPINQHFINTHSLRGTDFLLFNDITACRNMPQELGFLCLC